MKETVMNKEEMMGMLLNIHHELEEMETVLEKNVLNLQKEWYLEHSIKIENCGIKIEVLEIKFDQTSDIKETVKKYKMRHTPIKLELGYELT